MEYISFMPFLKDSRFSADSTHTHSQTAKSKRAKEQEAELPKPQKTILPYPTLPYPTPPNPTMAALPALPALPSALPTLSTRDAIIDALYRGIIGLDTANETLFTSAFTPDGVLDINGAVMTGVPAITAGCYATIAPLVTTHFVTNVRVHVASEDATTASMTASAMAQHYRVGQGLMPGAEHLLAGSLYYLDMVKDDKDGLWKATKFLMRSCWTEGERAIARGG